MTHEEMNKFIAELRTYDKGAEPADGWWVAYNDLQKAADALEWFKAEFIASCEGQHEIELRLTTEVRKANAREELAFFAGAHALICDPTVDIVQAWQQYRCQDDSDWKAVSGNQK